MKLEEELEKIKGKLIIANSSLLLRIISSNLAVSLELEVVCLFNKNADHKRLAFVTSVTSNNSSI